MYEVTYNYECQFYMNTLVDYLHMALGAAYFCYTHMCTLHSCTNLPAEHTLCYPNVFEAMKLTRVSLITNYEALDRLFATHCMLLDKAK